LECGGKGGSEQEIKNGEVRVVGSWVSPVDLAGSHQQKWRLPRKGLGGGRYQLEFLFF